VTVTKLPVSEYYDAITNAAQPIRVKRVWSKKSSSWITLDEQGNQWEPDHQTGNLQFVRPADKVGKTSDLDPEQEKLLQTGDAELEMEPKPAPKQKIPKSRADFVPGLSDEVDENGETV
jgi:hypothetical protein